MCTISDEIDKCLLNYSYLFWGPLFIGPQSIHVQQQGGHVEHLMQKLQDVTVTLDNNGDNKHVVSCCKKFFKCVVTEFVLFSIVAFKTLTFHKVV